MAFLDLSCLMRKFLSQQQAFETLWTKMFIITGVPSAKPLLQKNKNKSNLFLPGCLIASGECHVRVNVNAISLIPSRYFLLKWKCSFMLFPRNTDLKLSCHFFMCYPPGTKLSFPFRVLDVAGKPWPAASRIQQGQQCEASKLTLEGLREGWHMLAM